MTKTAVIFLDTHNKFNDKSTAFAKITGISLIKRLLLDLRRAKMENVFLVVNEKTGELQTILENTKGNFRQYLFGDADWRKALLKTPDASALVITADRLTDYRFLEKLACADCDERVLISVDRNEPSAKTLADKMFVANDGKVITPAEAQNAREAGIYLFPASAVASFKGYETAYLRERAEEFRLRGEADYFDIGSGFVEVIDSKKAVRRAENRLLRYLWKEVDGIYSRTNKQMILPFIKLALRTPLTPNMISLIGAFIAILSAYFFATGDFANTIIGALLGWVSSMLDHVDGSVARLKSKESAFGTYFESICDYVYYISFGVGMTVGLYRASGNYFYVALGAAALFGIVMTILTTMYQRKSFASKANLYSLEAHKKLEMNSQNRIVYLGRTCYFIVRRAVLPYYVLLFTIFQLLPFVLFMTALSANLFWMFHLYTNRLFRSKSPGEDEAFASRR